MLGKKQFFQIVGVLLCLLFSSIGFAAESPKTHGVSVKVNKVAVKGDVPQKQITIINNTSVPIYPYIYIGKHDPVDQWLQAFFHIPNPEDPGTVDKFKSTKVYKVYIGYDPVNSPQNPIVGISPGHAATITVPLYSDLVAHPDGYNGKDSDQYVDWWNGGRVLLSDNQEIIHSLFKNESTAVTLPDPTHPSGVYCAGKFPDDMADKDKLTYQCSLSPIYAADQDPANATRIPEQLTEYTMGGIDPSQNPYGWSPQNVDYDISYVDHVYLPVAMEPSDNKTIGYIGSIKQLDDFRTHITKFLQETNWPIYSPFSDFKYDSTKVPGAYNAAMDLTNVNSPALFQSLIANWKNCPNTANAPLCATVKQLFDENYKSFATECADGEPGAPTDEDYVQHIYGYVPFNVCKNNTTIDNRLANTPNVDFETADKAYKKLQYSTVTYQGNNLRFNDFVKFIHDPDYLNIRTSYAFSVDDRFGNMQVPGSGLYFAIGNSTGLPNPNEYDPTKLVLVDLGNPTSSLGWLAYKICGNDIATPFKDGAISFAIQSDQIPDLSPDKPCPITVYDTANHEYHFTLKNQAPFVPSGNPPLEAYIGHDEADTQWGKSIIISTTGSADDPSEPQTSVVNTPSPISPEAIILNFPAQWTYYGVCKGVPDTGVPKAESVTLERKDFSPPCLISVTDSSKVYHFTVEQLQKGKAQPPIYSIKCDVGDMWCKNVNMDVEGAYPQQKNYIGIPAPYAFTPPTITNAVRESDLTTVKATVTFPEGEKPSDYTYGCHYYDVDGEHIATCQGVETGTAIFSNLPTHDIKITITATTVSTPHQDATSNAYDVSDVNSLQAPVITLLQRTGTPTTAYLNFDAATGGTPPYEYTCTVEGTPGASCSGLICDEEGTCKTTLYNAPLTAAEVIVKVTDKNNNMANSIAKLLESAQLNAPVINAAYRDGADAGKVTAEFTPASGGTRNNNGTYTYTCNYLENGNSSSANCTVDGGTVIFTGLPNADIQISITAVDSANPPRNATSNLYDVPASSTQIVPPVLSGAARENGDKTKVTASFTAATGGTGQGFTYEAYVNEAPVGEVTPGNIELSNVTLDEARIYILATDKGDTTETARSNIQIVHPVVRLKAPVINSAYRDSNDKSNGTVIAEITPASGGTAPYTYTCSYMENGNPSSADCEVSGGTATFTGLPNKDIQISITASDSANPPKNETSNLYDVPASGSQIVAPVLSNAKRAAQDPTKITASFTAATGGTGQGFTYAAYLNNVKVADDLQPGAIELTNVTTDAAELYILATDKGDTKASQQSNRATVPSELKAPEITGTPQRDGTDPTKVQATITLPSGGTPSYSYTCSFNAGGSCRVTVNGTSAAFAGVPNVDGMLTLIATDSSKPQQQATSKAVDVPAAAVNPLKAPVINNANRRPTSPQTVVVNYSPATGGVGKVAYTYNINGKPWSNVSVISPRQVFLNWVGTAPVSITITATDSENHVATSAAVNIK